MVDTGIMNGADIVASIALGADFTLIGRAYLYGLMAGGRRGVDRTIAILRSEIERTMRLLGVSSLAELEPRHVTQLTRMVPVAAALSTAAEAPQAERGDRGSRLPTGYTLGEMENVAPIALRATKSILTGRSRP